MSDSNPPPEDLEQVLTYLSSLDKCEGFHAWLKPEIERQSKLEEDRVCNGGCEDWADYKAGCARISALKGILKHIETTKTRYRFGIVQKLKGQGING